MDFLIAQSPLYEVGSPATKKQVHTWDILLPPDGAGLPPGGGTAIEGRKIYDLRCAECHGENGEGGDAATLAGGRDTLTSR